MLPVAADEFTTLLRAEGMTGYVSHGCGVVTHRARTGRVRTSINNDQVMVTIEELAYK